MEDILSKSFLENLIENLPLRVDCPGLLHILESNIQRNINEPLDGNRTPEIVQLAETVLKDAEFRNNARSFLRQFLSSAEADAIISEFHFIVAREIQRFRTDL